jgi:hypothetical protein
VKNYKSDPPFFFLISEYVDQNEENLFGRYFSSALSTGAGTTDSLLEYTGYPDV